MKNMFENNDFFTDVKNNKDMKVEIKLPNIRSNILFGIVSIVTSIISFCVMFGGYSALNFAKEIADRPFNNIKLMVYTALILFSLSAIVFGIIGIVDFFKKGKSCTSATISLIISILGAVLGCVTLVMSFILFFMQ